MDELSPLTPLLCSRCSAVNPPSSTSCARCGSLLESSRYASLGSLSELSELSELGKEGEVGDVADLDGSGDTSGENRVSRPAEPALSLISDLSMVSESRIQSSQRLPEAAPVAPPALSPSAMRTLPSGGLPRLPDEVFAAVLGPRHAAPVVTTVVAPLPALAERMAPSRRDPSGPPSEEPESRRDAPLAPPLSSGEGGLATPLPSTFSLRGHPPFTSAPSGGRGHEGVVSSVPLVPSSATVAERIAGMARVAARAGAGASDPSAISGSGGTRSSGAESTRIEVRDEDEVGQAGQDGEVGEGGEVDPLDGRAPHDRPRREDPARRDEGSATRGSDGARAPIDVDPLIGFVVSGRYRILERLGQGGMGMVYRVEHLHLGKLLALKLLAGELSRDLSINKRFKREAFLAAKLTHQNTVQVFDYGVSDGLTWLVMELVRGDDLSRMIRRDGAMPFERAIPIIAQVCASIEEAHEAGIIHRDIKPANIMVTRSLEGADHAKVLDFGLAKLRESAELNEVTSRGAVMGTPYYMAPEQIQARDIDERADIYAIGAVLYRLVTGEPVFAGSGPQQIFHGHLMLPPVPPDQRAPGRHIPRALSAAILKALAKKPADRFQKVGQLRAALLEVLDREHGVKSISNDRHTIPLPLIHPENATRDEVAAYERKLQRQRWISRASVAAILALVVGLVYAGVANYRSWSTPVFDGSEVEPNDDPPHAVNVPLGQTVLGTIGKRLDRDRPDVDFFRVTLPEGAPSSTSADLLSIRVTALPNMALCLLVYPRGESDPLARYCPGNSRLDLVVPALRLTPGTYLFAVTQDRAPHGKTRPEVIENVSDPYELTVARATETRGGEIEPNDAADTSDTLAVGASIHGRLAWVGDVDVICAAAEPGKRVRWLVSNGESQQTHGSVLEISEIGREKPQITRLHSAASAASGAWPGSSAPSLSTASASSTGRAGPPRAPSASAVSSGFAGDPSDRDMVGPWKSEPLLVEAPHTACVRLRRVPDPQMGPDSPLEAPVGEDGWLVQLESSL